MSLDHEHNIVRPWMIRATVSVLVALIAGGSVMLSHATDDPVEVTTCGQRVSGAGYLSGDLDCSGSEALHGIILEAGLRRGTLELRGFSIFGPPVTPGAAIRCNGNCDIFGGGGSVSGGVWGIAGDGRVRVYDTFVRDTGGRGIDGGPATRLFNVTITGAGKEAVTGFRHLIHNCTITGNGNGSIPPSPTVHADRVAVFDSIVTGNEGVGVEGVSVRIRDSDVSNNGTSPACGVTHNCNFDIGSFRKPRIRDTVCGHSFDSRACTGCQGELPLTVENNPELHDWDVCTLD